MITVDQISKNNVRRATIIDNMTEKYTTDSGLYVVPSPSLWILERNLFYLLRNSEEKTFDQKYIMKPHYMSYDEYGTTILDYILMYVNGVFSMEDFNLNTIVVPSLNSIIEVASGKFSVKSPNEYSTVNW